MVGDLRVGGEMSMYGRDPWGGPLEICHDSATDDDRSRNMDLDRAALSRTLDETQQSWLLAGPGDQARKKKRYVDLGCLLVSRKLFVWTVGVLVAAAVLAGIAVGIAEAIPRHQRSAPPPDQYTLALHKALRFFNAQKCEDFSLCSYLLPLLCGLALCERLEFFFLCWSLGADFGCFGAIFFIWVIVRDGLKC